MVLMKKNVASIANCIHFMNSSGLSCKKNHEMILVSVMYMVCDLWRYIINVSLGLN